MSRRTTQGGGGTFSAHLKAATGTAGIALDPALTRPELTLSSVLEEAVAHLSRAWQWLQKRAKAQRRSRKLRICESAQLGDKRFVAVVQADGQRFLIGGTSNSISLLATLPARGKSRGSAQHKPAIEGHES